MKHQRRAKGHVVEPVLAQVAAVAEQQVVGDGRVFLHLVFDVGFLLPAVVADVHEQRIVHQAVAFDVVHEPAHAVVPPGHVGIVELGRFRDVHVPVVLAVGVGRVERHVRQRRREPDEERLLPVAVDEIEHRLHGLAHQIVAVGAHQLLEKAVAAVGRQVPAFAHAFGEMTVAIVVLPPFAALPAHIAGFAEQLWQSFEFAHGRGLFHLLPKPSLAVAERLVAGVFTAPPLDDFVLAQNVLHRMQAGDQGAQRGAAIGGRDMGMGECGSARGQGVHGGCHDIFVAHEAKIRVAVVVAHEQDDIRRPLGQWGAAGEEQQGEDKPADGAYAVHFSSPNEAPRLRARRHFFPSSCAQNDGIEAVHSRLSSSRTSSMIFGSPGSPPLKNQSLGSGRMSM